MFGQEVHGLGAYHLFAVHLKAGHAVEHTEQGVLVELEQALLTGRDLRSTETLASHADWVESFLPKYDTIDESNVTDIIREEIGLVFSEVLECAGVYKCTEEGRKYFQRFIDSVR